MSTMPNGPDNSEQSVHLNSSLAAAASDAEDREQAARVQRAYAAANQKSLLDDVVPAQQAASGGRTSTSPSTLPKGVPPQNPLDPAKPEREEGTKSPLQATFLSLGAAIKTQRRMIKNHGHFFQEKIESLGNFLTNADECKKAVRDAKSDLQLKLAKNKLNAQKDTVRRMGRVGSLLDVPLDLVKSLVLFPIDQEPISNFIEARILYPNFNKRMAHMRRIASDLQKIPEARNEETGIFYDPVAGTWTPTNVNVKDGNFRDVEKTLKRLERKYKFELAEVREARKKKVQEGVAANRKKPQISAGSLSRSPNNIVTPQEASVSTPGAASSEVKTAQASQQSTRDSLKVAHAGEVQVNGGATEKTTTPDQNVALSTTRRTAGLRPKV